MAVRLPRMSRSTKDDHSGTCKRLIRARFTTVMEVVVVFMVWDSSTTTAGGPEPKDDG